MQFRLGPGDATTTVVLRLGDLLKRRLVLGPDFVLVLLHEHEQPPAPLRVRVRGRVRVRAGIEVTSAKSWASVQVREMSREAPQFEGLL